MCSSTAAVIADLKKLKVDTVSMALDHPGFLFNALHPGVLAHEIKFYGLSSDSSEARLI